MTMKKIIDATKAAATTAVNISKTTGKAIYDFAIDCKRDSDIVANYRAQQYHAQQYANAVAAYKIDYDRVANALQKCLNSNHSKCGLSDPKWIEDIYCADETMSIDLDAVNRVTFRYEVDRHTSDLYDGGMKKTNLPIVDTKTIKGVLNRELPKYTRDSRYRFAALNVDDISGGQVRIEINGVWREPIII